MIKTLPKKQIMSSKIEKLNKEIPIGVSGFSLAPDLTGCPDYPENTSPLKRSGQSDPLLKTQIENELRGIPLRVQVDALHNLLCLLEEADASFKKKIYDRNNFKHWPADIVCKNCFSLN